jgi:hypothetical protein
MSVPPGTSTSMASRLPITFAIASARLMLPIPFSIIPGSNVLGPAMPLRCAFRIRFRRTLVYVCRGCANPANVQAGQCSGRSRRATDSTEVPILTGDAGRRDERFTCLRAAHRTEAGVSAVAPVRFKRIEIDPTGGAARLFPDGFCDPRECTIRTEAAPRLSRRRAVQVHIGSWPTAVAALGLARLSMV